MKTHNEIEKAVVRHIKFETLDEIKTYIELSNSEKDKHNTVFEMDYALFEVVQKYVLGGAAYFKAEKEEEIYEQANEICNKIAEQEVEKERSAKMDEALKNKNDFTRLLGENATPEEAEEIADEITNAANEYEKKMLSK